MKRQLTLLAAAGFLGLAGIPAPAQATPPPAGGPHAARFANMKYTGGCGERDLSFSLSSQDTAVDIIPSSAVVEAGRIVRPDGTTTWSPGKELKCTVTGTLQHAPGWRITARAFRMHGFADLTEGARAGLKSQFTLGKDTLGPITWNATGPALVSFDPVTDADDTTTTACGDGSPFVFTNRIVAAAGTDRTTTSYLTLDIDDVRPPALSLVWERC